MTFSPRLKQGDSCINHHCTATEVVASYTMSDRRYFPCVPRYGMYLSSGLLLKPFMQNINGSVFIAVVNRVTRRTFPLTDAEVLDSHILIAAATACLAAWIECIVHAIGENYFLWLGLRLDSRSLWPKSVSKTTL